MSLFSETIVALATPAQNAAIGIIRLSGPQSAEILRAVFFKPDGAPYSQLKPRYFHFGKIIDQNQTVLDECLVVWMPGPHTFTGEDVVEIHSHGNLFLLKSVLQCLLKTEDRYAIRAAEPGEFSKRAFLHGKMDLTQAEAIHDLITAESEASLKANLANLDGELARQITSMRETLLASLALIEASFEFPEEDIQTYDDKQVYNIIEKTQDHLKNLLAAYATSKLYDEKKSVAIVGRPNVGKSSLLNALLVEDRAIVTDIAGTTRDVVTGDKMLNGMRFSFFDTAGLRETRDIVESEGIARSRLAAEKADVVLYVTDDPNETLPNLPNRNLLFLLNKIDLLDDKVHAESEKFDFTLSVKSGFDRDSLEKMILNQILTENVQNDVHINQRQFFKIQQSVSLIDEILGSWASSQETEILAEQLRHLISYLDEITGKITSDQVLGEIFQRFCIGK